MGAMTPSEVVHGQFDAYNARDAAGLAAFYAEDCVFADLAGVEIMRGRAAFEAQFRKTFADHPQNRSWSANRLVVGEHVIDHEINQRTPGGPTTQPSTPSATA
jgi:uncharacterized protein (TIGR02246 family)